MQFQEMLNQPLLVDDDAEIDEGPWDCKSCGHHNILPTRTCDACGAVRLDKSAFEVEDNNNEDDRERPKLRRDNTIWGWEISGDGAFQWLRRTLRDVVSPDDDDDDDGDKNDNDIGEKVGEVSTKDSEYVALNVDEENETESKSNSSKEEEKVKSADLGGWLWEMIDLKRERRRRRRRRKRKKKRKKMRKKVKKEGSEESEDASSDSESESDSDSSSSLSSLSSKYVMRWSDASKPIRFRPLPAYVKDVTLPDIAEASKLSLGKKMQWFRKRLASLRIPWDDGHVKIEIRRDSVRDDSLNVSMTTHAHTHKHHRYSATRWVRLRTFK